MVYNPNYVPDSALTETEKKLNQEIDTVYQKLNRCSDLLASPKVAEHVRKSINIIMDQYKVKLNDMKYSVAEIDENLQKVYISQFKYLFDSIKAKTEEYLRYCTKVTTETTVASSNKPVDVLLKRAEFYCLIANG